MESTISISRKIHPKLWDSVRGIVKIRTNEAEELNPYIETLREKATEAHRQLIREGKPATPEGIFSLILRPKG
ncbi:MAG: Arm DNA-binding domain-containing protein [Bacteroidales bacterium]